MVQHIRVTLTLAVPDGVELVDVETAVVGEAAPDPSVERLAAPKDAVTAGLSPSVLARIGTAPQRRQEALRRFAERCVAELGAIIVVPQGKRPDYLNVYPPTPVRRNRRVAAFSVREGDYGSAPRAEIYCSPSHAADHPPAEQDTHNGVPVHCKIRLEDEAAIDSAVALVAIAIRELGR